MNESKDPNLHWFEIECGSYKVGTWAASRRAAVQQVKRSGYLPSEPNNKYGHNSRSMAGIVL